MLLDVVCAFYLNSSAVQDAFRKTPPGDRDAGRRWSPPTQRVRSTHEHPSVAAAAAASDIELLRRFEPIVRYTDGELFLPAPVDGYLAACDLLVGRSERERTVLVPVGGLSADDLAGHTRTTRRDAVPATRPAAIRRHRADPLAAAPGPAGLPRARSSRARRPVRAARGRRLHGVAAAPRHGPGRHGRRRPGQVRGCGQARPAHRLSRPGRPPQRLDRRSTTSTSTS